MRKPAGLDKKSKGITLTTTDSQLVDESTQVVEDTQETEISGQESAVADTTANSADDSQQVDPRVKRANSEAASYRVKAREAEQQAAQLQQELETIKNSLSSLFGGQTEATPEEQLAAVIAERDSAMTALKQERLSSSLRDAAYSVGVDPQLLVPLMRGLGKFDDLDPAADNFTEVLNAQVAGVLEQYPHLKPTKVAQTSGVNPKQYAPEAANDDRLTIEDVQRLAAEGKWDVIDKARKAGKIKY